MFGANTKSGFRKALLGAAGAMFSLALLADGALAPAGREEGNAAAGVVQAIQMSAQVVYEGGARFVGNMQTLYQLARLEELVPQAGGTTAPRKNEKFRIFVCSETQPIRTAGQAGT
jgi:hypothetical protein